MHGTDAPEKAIAMKVDPRLFETYNTGRLTFAARMRIKRFKIVNSLIQSIIDAKGRCNILDIGGSKYYWDLNSQFIAEKGSLLHIILTNHDDRELAPPPDGTFSYRMGDATKRDLFDGEFDMIHSNSVIEHVGNWLNIRAMADNIRAYDAPYYIQTPNYWFPIEPHYRTLGFQWLPPAMRGRMLLKRARGFRFAETFDAAMDDIESINLLDHYQMTQLFPDSEIIRERVGPLTKSFMAVRRTGRQ